MVSGKSASGSQAVSGTASPVVNGRGCMKKTLVPHSKYMLLGRWVGQLGLLPKARLASDGRLVQLRRRVIIAIVLFVAIQSFFWANIYEMPYTTYLLVLAIVLNPVFTYCMIENLSSTAPHGIRDGLCAGCWVFYLLVVAPLNIGLPMDFSLALMMHIMFSNLDGTFNDMVVPSAFLYIGTTILCSFGALVGAVLGYLLAKLVAGARKICKWQLGSQ